MSCNICCDTYNASSRAKINCGYCDFDACRSCCETYILSEALPKCLNNKCNKEWSRKFIREKFTNTFINNKFKKHLEDILYEQEKALMPATQPIIEEMNRKKRIKQEITKMEVLIEELYRDKRILERSLNISELETYKSNQKSSFMRQCAAEGCRGFLSSQWKCGICEQWTCPECHELKGANRDDPDHKCDPNNIETAKLLNKDTKPCPKCQTKIYKIDGCDQMWCTQCHTAFSWKTGAIQTSIHNPHYFEWRRKHGGGEMPRAAGDIVCGQELSHNTTTQIENLIYARNQNTHPNGKNHTNLCATIKPRTYYYRPAGGKEFNAEASYPNEYNVTYKENVRNFTDKIRQILHIRHVEMPRFNVDHFEKNQELRVKYLCNEITEEELKILVQRNDKKHRKQTEILNVLRMLETTMTDITYRIMDDLKNSPTNEHHFDELVKEVNELIEYCNNLFRDISFTYNCVCYTLTDQLHLKTIQKEKKALSGSNKKKQVSSENNHKKKKALSDSDSDSDSSDSEEEPENKVISVNK